MLFRSIVDIKDQWPQFFVDSAPYFLKKIVRLFFSPYFYVTKRIIKEANAVTANSNAFLKWSLKFGNRIGREDDTVIPLTVPQFENYIDNDSLLWWERQGINVSRKKSIIFIGSHYPSLDLDTVIESAKILKERNVDCDIVICGSGELTNKLKIKAKSVNNVFFPGWVNNKQISCINKFCIASLSPFKNIENYLVNIPNKVVDSLAYGLPILSPLKGEVSKLINENQVGLLYEEKSKISLANQIEYLIGRHDLQTKMSMNAKHLYEKQFSYEIVYGKLTALLEKLSIK